jgi:hypothetical protein
VLGGNPGQDDLDAIGVLDPHLGQAPGLRGGSPDDGDCGRGQPGVPGVDIPTCVQIITECPGEPAVYPETPGNPGPRKNTTPGSFAGPNSR